MGDRRLRERERAWLGDADRESEQAYLRERVRLGTLSEDRYALAAALGAPGLGGPEHPPLGFQAWLEQLPFRRKRGRYERDWARVPLALAQRCEGYALALGVSERYTHVLQVCRQSLACGSRPSARTLRVVNGLHGQCPYSLRGALAFLQRAVDALRGSRSAGPAGYGQIARDLLFADTWNRWAARRIDGELLEAHFPEANGRLWGMRVAIRDALLPWALE